MTVTETAYKPNLVIPPHAHGFAYYCAVLFGSFEDVAGSQRRSCVRSTVFLRPREEVHQDEFALSGARCLTVELKPHFVERLDSEAPLKKHRDSVGGPVFGAVCRLGAELEAWDEFSTLAVEGLALELVAESGRSAMALNPNVPRWLRRAVEILTADRPEFLTLSEVAAAVLVHPTHLARVFRAAHGCSVGEFVRRRKIQLCCDRLSQLDRPLSTIALDAGFADQSHFCRVFKRVTGESPTVYRQRVYGRKR